MLYQDFVRNSLKWWLLAAMFFPLWLRAQTLTLSNDIQTHPSLTSTTVTMTGRSELRVTNATTPLTSCVIHLNSVDAWLFLTNVLPSTVQSTYLGQVRINGAAAVHGTNCRVVQYGDGTVVIPHGASFAPMTVYSGRLFTGTSTTLTPYTAYSSSNLGAFDNQISSFKLKRGYMATIAQNSAGTGVSRNYVAQDGDLEVNVLPTDLENAVSFVRVFPWRWVNKKGIAGNIASGLNVRWWYNWNLDQNSTLDREYVAIRQNRWWPGLGQDWSARGINHLLGYNEPDHVDQANMTVADAISGWPDLLGTGLRVGSPAPTDGGRNWLYSFISEAEAADYRVDFAAVHYYWCFNPSDPNGAANQMYNFLKSVYDTIKRPIWITEWNNGANWTGCGDPSSSQQKAAVEAMMEMLDDAPFVERYALYNWVEDSRRVKWDDGSLTSAGVSYRDKVSPLSYWQQIPAVTLTAASHYKFENNPTDSSGNGQIAILKGAAKYGTGKTGQGLALSGTASNGDYVQLTPRTGDSTDFTFGAWVYWSGGDAYQRVFDLGSGTSNYMFLTPASASGVLRFAIKDGGAEQQLNSSVPMPLNTWTHIAVTISGSTGKLFVNGAVTATNSSMSINPVDIATEFNFLGKSQFSTDPYFAGRLDDVQFLPYALSDAKVAQMITNSAPVFSSITITKPAGTQGTAYTGTIAGSATDANAGDSITYSKLKGPAWLTVSSAGVLGGTPTFDDEGPQDFVVGATDTAGGSATAVLSIPLPSVNGAGVWAANASGTWGDATKWSNSFPANGAENLADFSTLNITSDTTVTLDRSRSIGGLTFGDTSGTQNWTVTSSSGSTLTLEAANAATLAVNQNTTTLAVPISSPNGFRKGGAGTLILTGDNSIQGTVKCDTNSNSANDGALRFANPDAISGITDIGLRNNNAGRSSLELDGTARDITSAATISVAGRTNTSVAIRSLAGNNILSGAITLNGGGSSYVFQADAGLLTYDGDIDSTAGSTRTMTFSGAGSHYVGGEIHDDSASSTVLAITKTGAGSLTLQDKDNTFSGNIVVSGGTMSGISSASFDFGNAPSKGPLGNPQKAGRTITINNGGTLIFGTGNVLGPGGSTTAPAVSLIVNAGGNLRLAAPAATTPGPGGGDTNVLGPVTLSGGTLTTGNGYGTSYQAAILMSAVTANGSVASTITSNATNTVGQGIMLGKTGGGTITFDVTGPGLTISAPLVNAVSGATGNLIKSGSGPLTLAAANTYSGTTTVNAGSLVVNGSVTSAVTTVAGTTLSGTGSLSGVTTINGQHAPGGPTGKQTFGTVNYRATSRLKWALTSLGTAETNANRVEATTVSVTSGAAIDCAFNAAGVQFTDVFWQQPHKWPIISGNAITGAFTLGSVSQDASGRSISAYGSLALQQTATSVALVYSPLLSPHEQWLQSTFGTEWRTLTTTGDAEDPDGDGLSNLLERAFGGNPLVKETNLLPFIESATFSVIYQRSKTTPDLTISLQESSDLTNASWQPATGTFTMISEDSTVQHWRYTLPAPASETSARSFVRIKVTR